MRLCPSARTSSMAPFHPHRGGMNSTRQPGASWLGGHARIINCIVSFSPAVLSAYGWLNTCLISNALAHITCAAHSYQSASSAASSCARRSPSGQFRARLNKHHVVRHPIVRGFQIIIVSHGNAICVPQWGVVYYSR